MQITKGQMNRAHGNLFTLAVIVMVAVLLSAPLPVIAEIADFTSTDRFSPSPVKEGAVDSDDVFSGITVIGNSELGGIRGGLRIGGLDINIGAIVRTFIDGRLALESQLTVAGNGIITNSLKSPASSEIPGSTFISGDGTGSTLKDVTPDGIKLDGLEGGSQGVVINDTRGFTAVLQNIRKDRILSTVINRASGRTIRHRVNVDVTVRNFRQLQRAARSARLAQRISRR